MDLLQPTSWPEALAAKAAHPAAVPLCGGTDLLVELTFERRRPDVVLDLARVPELRHWSRQDGAVRVGAGVPYTRIVTELADLLPGLAMAARTVGSPQIRNRGTVGGNLGTASPAGDAHPPLLAAGALVEVASTARGTRRIPVTDFFAGPRRTVLADDELIAAVVVDVAAGPQHFAKVGTRNAMVIAVCAVAVALDARRRRVGTGIGSAGPTPLAAVEAQDLAAGGLDWDAAGPADPELLHRFGDLVAAAARPIDDVRGTAAYRRHAVAVTARRALTWTWEEYRRCA